MKRGLNPSGFTIVEVMIVLAVSGVLLVSALTLVSGSQNKQEFNVAINGFNEQLTKIVNNVANGYYPNQGTTGQRCRVAGVVELNFTGGAQALGSQLQCVYLGRIIEFTDSDYYNVYSVAGARELSANVVNTKYATSISTVLPSPEKIFLKNGLKIVSVKVNGADQGSVGFFTTLGEIDSATNRLASGSLSLDYIAASDNGLATTGGVPSYIKGAFRTDMDNPTFSKKNPANGIVICLDSGLNNTFGVITIGGAGKTTTTTVEIMASCP